jgi:hypothetical protein
MGKQRIGKNERWILAECLKRHPKPLIKWDVLQHYYGLIPDDENGLFKRRFKGVPGHKGRRHKAQVSYTKSKYTLLSKGLISVSTYWSKGNADEITLTDAGLVKIQHLKKRDAKR